MDSLIPMLDPKSVALVGATEREASTGRLILENLLRSGRQRIFAINPNEKSALGLDCYPTVGALPEKPNLTVIAVRAELVPAVAEECGEAGIKGILVISTGFTEQDEAGLLTIAKKYGMRLLGPGSLGIVRPSIGLNASLHNVVAERGNIAFISQSGQLGGAVLEWACEAHVGVSLFVSLGRALDVDFGDLIDFLGDDHNTRSILLDMEQIVNARHFMSAARGFARSKPIIVLKAGRFPEGHEPRSRMDDLVYDAAFKRVGLVRVREVADLFNAAQVLDAARLPKGPRLAIVTNGHTAGLIAKDALIDQGGEPARLSAECYQGLHTALPHWNEQNPIDLEGPADIDQYMLTMNCCLKDPEVDALLIIHLPRAAATPIQLANALDSLSKEASKPVLVTMMGAGENKEAARVLIANHIPTYAMPEEAVKTYIYMCNYKKNLDLLYETPEALPLDQAPPKYHLKALVAREAGKGVTVLSTEQSLGFLQNYGVPTVRTYTVLTEEEALRAAKRIGYPVALKTLVGRLLETGERRAVLGISSDDALGAAFRDLKAAVSDESDGRPFEITVQKMVKQIDYELLLHADRHRDFGCILRFGARGVSYDLFHDYSVGLPPLNQTLARRLIEETKTYQMLTRRRGSRPTDFKQLQQVLVSFSNLIVDFPEIASIEIEPLIVTAGSISAMTARIFLSGLTDTSGTAFYPHLVISPYPARYVTEWSMRDGTSVVLRPIRPEDEPLENEMLTTLSERTLRQRFFSLIQSWTHETLVRFCNIDYDREMAIVAYLRGANRIVGIGRLIVQSDYRSGEFAVLVHDDFQGQGLGYKLTDVMIGIAQDKGLEEMEAIVLSNNEGMLKVARNFGFTRELLPDGISKVTLRLR